MATPDTVWLRPEERPELKFLGAEEDGKGFLFIIFFVWQ